ncbi:methyltransferase domain-containing protein [Candidatus Dependentiae bacterium]|nr:methyltransferase domain-containing protein [Candidatus Dependentiae bacterium]
MPIEIKPSDKVIEIGPGGGPKTYSDILIEKYIDFHGHRGNKPLYIDRPLLEHPTDIIPFRDKTFDYSLAYHVLEHTENPEIFLKELQRISKAGIIETPSVICELLYGSNQHKLLCWFDEEKKRFMICLKDFSKWYYQVDFRGVFNFNFHYSEFMTNMFVPGILISRYCWKDKIDFCITDNENELFGGDINKVFNEIAAKVKYMESSNLSRKILKKTYTFINRANDKVKWEYSKLRHKIYKKDEWKIIEENLICPYCKSRMDKKESSFKCASCQFQYIRENNILRKA